MLSSIDCDRNLVPHWQNKNQMETQKENRQNKATTRKTSGPAGGRVTNGRRWSIPSRSTTVFPFVFYFFFFSCLAYLPPLPDRKFSNVQQQRQRQRERKRKRISIFFKHKKTTSQSRSGSWSMGLDGQCCFFFIFLNFFFCLLGLPGFVWVFWVSNATCPSVLPKVIGFYWVLLGFIGFNWV